MILRIVRAALLALAAIVAADPGAASAQSILRVARGLASDDIVVLTNRAIVVESSQPFTELSIAQPEIADVQPLSDRSIYILGRRRGKTTLTMLGEGGRLISNVNIVVRPDISELKERLSTILPQEDIEVRIAGGNIVLSGIVSGATQQERALTLARAYAGDAVANMMTIGGTQQVALKVRVAEMNRNAVKDIGVSIAALGSGRRYATDNVTGDALALTDPLSSPAGPNAPPGSSGNLAGIERIFSGAFGAFGAIFAVADNFILDIEIDALESKGFLRMLAEPTLVALSGTEAEFLAGGEVPIPAVDGEGNVSVDFRATGVNVSFVPVVLDGSLINLAVTAEVSAPDPSLSSTSGGINITGFQTRRVTTTIELRDGQSFAIAGLFQEDFSDAIDQVPFLGDIPILGTLFRSAQFQKRQTELVIMVTVNLVTPVDNEDELALPTDRFGVPTEFELFLMGNALPGNGSNLLTTQGFDGDFGYVVE
ncbi:type II and III secretion system protein family protein [Paralimibaculum aggregatum]|uniref:Type II and III secretion system protein family protein n=1 Tax=Paralimibaculum aggregatum TaxID=3036245 RepID=A0ABQ6LQ52_9RHOB|nr:type II and III secretion system protein family protein [Limibaculum sp. NKW23]GMG82934.1 type II and III secretion system protein family protein [Limibaculum sp. NKW23]